MSQARIELRVEKRTVVGKQVKKLRKAGIIPANVFGQNMPSESIQVDEKLLTKVMYEAGMTHVIYLILEKESIPVLCVGANKHSLTDHLLHVDFKKVNLREQVEADVPVVMSGENELVKAGEADVILVADTVRVEALPTKIPEEFSIDVSQLKEIGVGITVGQLPKSDDYTFVDEEAKTLVQLVEVKKEEAEPQESPSPESVEATEEKPEEEKAAEE